MDYFQQLTNNLQQSLSGLIDQVVVGSDVTVELPADNLLQVAETLRDDGLFQFKVLLDVCGVDYLEYGKCEWQTNSATDDGFSRAVSAEMHQVIPWDKPRYAVVYHLLSMKHNQRLRVKVYLNPEPSVPSVVNVWPSAEWYEREAFDMFGIVFDGHPDLRRLLTDYGFTGHPFRKDFPLIGEVEMHYDAKLERCVYAPVSIKPRVLVPKVIRIDHRYSSEHNDEEKDDG
jgi:NADH-quinone oxidoreductase subunit C